MARGTTTVDTDLALYRAIDLPLPGGYTVMCWSRGHAQSAGASTENFAVSRSGGSSVNLRLDSSGGSLGALISIPTAGGDWLTTWDYIDSAWSWNSYHHYAIVLHSPNSTLGGPYIDGFVDGHHGAQIIMNAALDSQIVEIAAVGAIPGTGVSSSACFNQHFRFWRRPLTPGEIQTEMWSRFAVSRQGLVADLPLIDDEKDLVEPSAWSIVGSGGSYSTDPGPQLGGHHRNKHALRSAFSAAGNQETPQIDYGGPHVWSSIERPARV